MSRLSPSAIVLLTEECDKACPHCFNTWDPHMAAGAARVDWDAARALIAAAAARGLAQVAFTGGEPLLHARAVEAVADAHGLGLRTQLFTSGTRMESMAPLLSWAGLDEVRLSFNEFPYAEDAAALDRMWPVFAARAAPVLAWLGDRVMVNAIASRRSLPLVATLRERLAALGVRRVKVQPLYVSPDNPWYERLTLHGVTAAEWDAHDDAVRAAGAHGQADYLALFRGYYQRGSRPARCGAAPMLVIGADGRVHPCLNRFDLTAGTLGAHTPEALLDSVAAHDDLRRAACFREECLCLFRPQELG